VAKGAAPGRGGLIEQGRTASWCCLRLYCGGSATRSFLRKGLRTSRKNTSSEQCVSYEIEIGRGDRALKGKRETSTSEEKLRSYGL